MPPPMPNRHTTLDAFRDDDKDDDFADRLNRHSSSSRANTRDKEEALLSFGRNGAEKRDRSPSPVGPRVIPMVANLDWREDRKRRLGIHDRAKQLGSLTSMSSDSSKPQPSGDKSSQQSASRVERINDGEQVRGLQIRAKKTGGKAEPEVPSRSPSPPTTVEADAHQQQQHAAPPENADQAAIKALLAGEAVGSSSATRSQLVIPQLDEREVLQNDVDTRPDAPTLDDYAATPVDEFGAAMLRGMGWVEGQGGGRNGRGPQSAPEPKRRAALLGLGAKERTPLSQGNIKSSRPDRKYMPIIREASSRGSREVIQDDRSSNPRDDSRHSSRRRDRSESPRPRHERRRRSPEESSSRRHDHSRSTSHRNSSAERYSERSRHEPSDRSSRHDRDHHQRRRDDRDDRRRNSHRDPRRGEVRDRDRHSGRERRY